jgi:N-lysine methyltransferase SETD6
MTSAQATHNALFDEFLAWCAMHDIVVNDEAVTFAARSSEGGGGGRGVLCGTRDLAAGERLARIPVSMCLTLSTCGMPDVAEAIHAKVVEQKLLAGWLCEAASALCVERHLGRASKYFAYIRVLPDCEPNVVSMWSDEERGYLVNTEVEVGLRDELREARREWDCIVEEVFKAHDVKCSFDLFHRARTVVSSRAFQISPTCGIGLAPIADCFNHRTGGHDVNVGDGGGSVSTSENDALAVRIVREGGVKSGKEIFNTYGFLGNARLLNSYGFTQRDNPADVVSLSTTNIRVAAAMVGISGSQIAKRFEWIESTSLISSADASFDINRACTLPDDLMYVVWACVEDDDIFRKVRHTTRRDDAINAILTVAKAMESAHEQQPMMTCSVVKVISSAIERRLSMYATVGDEERGKNERLECAAILIESERQILKGALEKLEKFSVPVSADEGSNKRAKSGDDAFALFD